MTSKLTKDIQDYILSQVKAGFNSRIEIIDAAIAYADGDYNYNWLRNNIAPFVDEAIDIHMLKQRQWTHETDCDRLDETFAELDRNGIVARQNFTCCQTCGLTDISYEIAATQEFHPVHGYVFYHMHDTESAVLNNYLYLAFGALSGKEADSRIIAAEIIATLSKHGLEADWNGDYHTRIALRNLRWQRRRVVEVFAS